MIKLEHLVKRYGSLYALDDVSLEIAEGEVVGLLGPNGAGKSTTMNILTGYLSATSGKATINGIDILENPLEAKRLIGYLPEQPPVYPDMTVKEYLRFVYELKGAKQPRGPHLREICETVKITDVYNRLIRNLSKGYRQRVGIAQALIGNPPVIIFDEPTVGLDPKQIIEIRNLLRTLGQKHTVILSTHILSEVQAVCERVVIIGHGRIIANEKTADITRAIEDSSVWKVKVVGPQRDVLNMLRDTAGVRRVDDLTERDGEAYAFRVEGERGVDIRKSLFHACAKNSWPLVGLEAIGQDLESIFIRLIDRAEDAAAEKKTDGKR